MSQPWKLPGQAFLPLHIAMGFFQLAGFSCQIATISNLTSEKGSKLTLFCLTNHLHYRLRILNTHPHPAKKRNKKKTAAHVVSAVLFRSFLPPPKVIQKRAIISCHLNHAYQLFFFSDHYMQHFKFLILNHCLQEHLENLNPKGKVLITGQSCVLTDLLRQLNVTANIAFQ